MLGLTPPTAYEPRRAPVSINTKPYDLRGIDTSYLDSRPYGMKHDFKDPEDHSAYNFSGCNQTKKIAGWVAPPSCAAQVKLTKISSGREVFRAQYTFDEHARRVIPDAKKNGTPLLFLGCSYTFGEGVSDHETFANLVTKKSRSHNGFNLGMLGFGPALVNDLLHQPKTDIRLSGITGRESIAIYTHIDDHFRRLANTITWNKSKIRQIEPKYSLDQSGNLFRDGLYSETNPIRQALFRLLSRSATLEYLQLDWPRISDSHLDLYAALVRDMKKSLEENFKSTTFIFSIYPNSNPENARKLREKLEKIGVVVFDFSTVNAHALMGQRSLILGNPHPSPMAHRFYADLLIHEGRRRGIFR